MSFGLDQTVIVQTAADTITSLFPWVLTALGLLVAGGAVAWSIGALKKWRSQ